MSAKRSLEAAREKMSPLLLLQKQLGLISSDSEDEADGKENGCPIGTLKTSATLSTPNKKRKITNVLGEEFKDEPRPSKKFKPNQASGEGEEAGPSEIWKCAVGPDPLKIKLTKVGSPGGKKEKEQRPAEEEPDDYAWLYADIIDLPDGEPVPDPNLSFLEKNKEAKTNENTMLTS
ncbi:hypothetical protein V5799_023421 [Amblyomma americanum]|uniref:Uncharacterized protein n=1 Tax=Amblyomma americanum TaxID=6943 RepID=A0AAQ4FJ61_AMBAM